MNMNEYKLLLVDDDAIYAEGRAILLEEKGIMIKIINNPVEAIEYLKSNKIDVILLDYFMPEMTGEQFLNELREFNNETVVILQTGYAGEKPQNEMLEQLNIQGYYDKTQSFDYLMLMVLSAIKAVKLLREIKQREEEKQIKKLKDKFFADKINTISCEINEKLMSIGGPTMILEDWAKENISEEEKQEFITKRLTYLKDAASQIKESVKALNIASETEMSPKNMLEKIYSLLKVEMSGGRANLEIKSSDDFVLINIEEGTVPYLICKDIENRVNAGSKDIKVTSVKDGDMIIIKISSSVGMSLEEKAQLEKVASFCEKVSLNITEGETEMRIERVKQ